MEEGQIQMSAPFITTCAMCEGTEFKDGEVSDDMVVDGVTYTDKVPARICVNCGEDYVWGVHLAEREDRLIETLERLDSRGPEAQQYIEKVLRGRLKTAGLKRKIEMEMEESKDGMG